MIPVTDAQKRANVLKWLEAAKSEEYADKQVEGQLATLDGKFCMLGIACEVVLFPIYGIKKEVKLGGSDTQYSYYKEENTHTPTYKALQHHLGLLDDNGGFSDKKVREICLKKLGWKEGEDESNYWKSIEDAIDDYTNDHHLNSIIDMNDDRGMSFKEIADHLMQHWDLYFDFPKEGPVEGKKDNSLVDYLAAAREVSARD